MKTSKYLCCAIFSVVFCLMSCSDDSGNSGNGTSSEPGTSSSTEPGTSSSSEPGQPSPGTGTGTEPGETPENTEHGECKTIDGKTYCPKLVIPKDTITQLEDIPGDCGGWEYPKHPEIKFPDLPEYGLEVTIDLEKYGITEGYDPEKAEANSSGFGRALEAYKEAGFTRIVIPDGYYALNSGGIRIPSKVALIMSNRVYLQMIPTRRWDCQLLNISNDDIYVEGGNLVGTFYEHTNSINPDTGNEKTDEECNAVSSYTSSRWFVNGTRIIHPHGDGFMIVGGKKDKTTGEYITNRDIIIANCDIDSAFRNGIAVGGIDTIRITGNHIHHTHGTPPAFGIDFESDHNGMGIVDHNSFNDNASGDIVLSRYLSDISFIEYNHFDIGQREKYNDGAFIPNAHNSYVLYRNVYAKFATSGGCSGHQLICTYGNRDESNNLKTFVVENEFPRQRVALARYNYMCIKENNFHEGVLAIAGIPNIRLYNNRVEKFEGKNSFQGMVDYAVYKNSIKGLAAGNVTCTLDESGHEVCEEISSLNEVSEENYMPGRHLSTF